MDKIFASTQKKLALLFSISTGIFVLLTTLLIITLISFELDRQAKNSLEKSLSTIENEIEENIQLDEKTISLQKSNLRNSRLPNVYDSIRTSEDKSITQEPDLQLLKEDKTAFSRVILENGDILFTSDLFDTYSFNHESVGFKKHKIGDVCIYNYNSKISSGENEGGIIQVAQYCPFSKQQQNSLYSLMFLIAVIIIISTYIGGLLLSKFFLRPMKRSVEQTRKFAQDCHHELLTPITVALSTVESSLKTKTYEEGLTSVEEDLISAYKSLELLNSQSFYDQSELEKKEIDIKIPFEECIEEIVKQHDLSIDVFQINLPKKPVIKNCNEIALRIIYKNLLSNALKYSETDSKVSIELSNKHFKISNSIEFTETIDINKFFTRNYRGDNSKSTDGNGIGLSIVKDLVEVHKWKINAKKINNQVVITIIF